MRRKKTVARAAILAIGCLVWSGGCASDDDDGDADTIVFDDAEILNDYAYKVVIPTYAWLADAAADLRTAAGVLIADTSEANLDSAKSAWTAARRPWEQSEAWLFGPVAALGLDPALDTWPINKTDLAARVVDELDAAVDALAAIPPPFSDAIVDPTASASIEAVQSAINTVLATLSGDVTLLVKP